MTDAAGSLTDDLAATGFTLLGGFAPDSDDLASLSPHDPPVTQVIMIGSLAPLLWEPFLASAEYKDGLADPLDRYTRRVLGGLASAFSMTAAFPFDGPPYHPFQKWALRCGGFSPSPIGVLAHHEFGPWAGLRAAFFASGDALALDTRSAQGPCPDCVAKPCVSACPVGAISDLTGYDVPACMAYLSSKPAADCWQGCLARKACPYGAEYGHGTGPGAFHMKSFMGF
ncbi:hypothetical protein JM93_03726 [Roseibium hamelinense]|uniref:4Fe-4S ferredoxin-type domain-containing protein n=1 Tax=Roseibium hamelinense TaxID=150831 RepID=A0A562SKJ4_9HYPH|nr:hypothetical protein [Roseibium hamelinense]MTI43305.1 hypothetical protein [Roseibium hamelinense]TWI81765.1 hypothetical protein JM93_03726 [Roseibium hamelinense]